MKNIPQQPLDYATPTKRPFLSPALRMGVSFVGLIATLVCAHWFWNNYFRIGREWPEWSEPIVFLVGWFVIALTAGYAFVQLIKGIKQLPPGPG